MEFEPIDGDLELVLGEIVEKANDEGDAKVSFIGRDEELKQLMRLGLVDERRSHMYMDGNALMRLTYDGKRYFERKEKWISSTALDAAGAVASEDAAELAKLASLAAKNAGKPITDGFDTEDEGENESIRRLSRRGLLDVMYADNVPWAVNVTPEGYDFIRSASSPKGKGVASKIASIAGTFTGAAVKEMTDL